MSREENKVRILGNYEEEHIDADSWVLIPLVKGVADYQRTVFLDGCAYDIWKMIKGEKTEQEIVSAIIDLYQVDDENAVREDIEGFLQQLVEVGIVE